MPDKTILKSILFKHLEYQQLVVEGCTDPAQNLLCYSKWADFCVITNLTPTYIKIKLPSKSNGPLVARYADRAVSAGLYAAFRLRNRY